jgi:cell division protein FtsQ
MNATATPANRARLMLALARACAAGAALLALAGAAAWFAQQPRFDIRRIEVHGDLRHVSAASVRAAVAGKLRGNYFTVRLDEARRAFDGVPWVAQASVRRAWPDRLVVTLTEHRALGVWNDGRILSDAGVLFVANAAEAESFGPLPQFAGPDDAAPEAARRYYEFASLLAPLDIEIERVSISERRSWSLHTRTGAGRGPVFELGRDEPRGRAGERLATIAARYPLVVARINGTAARFDARYTNGFAVAVAPAPRK